MFDTVKSFQPISHDDFRRLGEWSFTKKEGYFARYRDIAANPFCTVKISAVNRFGNIALNVEASYPKLVYGNNVEMLKASDLPMAFDAVSDLVSEVTGI